MLPLTAKVRVQTDVLMTVTDLQLQQPAYWGLNQAGTTQEMQWLLDLDIYAAPSLDVRLTIAGPGTWAGQEASVYGVVQIGEER